MSHILETLTKEDFALFEKKSIKKGEILFIEGELCSSLGILLSGSLIISSYTFEGQEIVFNTINEGMIFGNNLLFSKNPYYKGNVATLLPSIIYLINEKNLLSLCSKNKAFLREYLSLSANMTIQLNERVKLLSFNSLEERIAYDFFLNNGTIAYKSITDLAKDLNVERETLSRYISKAISNKRIKKEDHRLIDLNK